MGIVQRNIDGKVSYSGDEGRTWSPSRKIAALRALNTEAKEKGTSVEDAQASKVRENRLRRAAERQGLTLVKSRRRDPRAVDHGTFMLVDSNNTIVAGERMVLDDVERVLGEERIHARERRFHVALQAAIDSAPKDLDSRAWAGEVSRRLVERSHPEDRTAMLEEAVKQFALVAAWPEEQESRTSK